MNKEEIKQYLRTQINSSILIQSKDIDNRHFLFHNKQYLRALKFSKITGQPVNKENFKGGVKLFRVNTKHKYFYFYPVIDDYLNDNYSNEYPEQKKIIEDVLNEYDEYKEYKCW